MFAFVIDRIVNGEAVPFFDTTDDSLDAILGYPAIYYNGPLRWEIVESNV